MSTYNGYLIHDLGETSYWEEASLPLLELLSSPRNMREIVDWGKELKFTAAFTKNLLAYLSFRRKADYDPLLGMWKSL